MKKLHQQKGFTLVELAIVLTIVGLLIGGILKGQQLINNARVSASMAQVNAIEAATTTFRDTYNAIPGDMVAGNTRLPGYLNTTATWAGGANGIVGTPNFDWSGTAPESSLAITAAGATVTAESTLYWAALNAANLLSGISYLGGALAANAATFGTTNPVSKLGNGGFLVGNFDGTLGTEPPVSTAYTAATHTILSGMGLVLAPSATAALVSTAGGNPASPNTAAQIDRKMDDGNAATGSVQAFGVIGAAPSCATVAGVYNETSTGKDCGISFRIQQ